LFNADRKRTDGQRDLTKLIVASRNFANTPKNVVKKEAENVLQYEDITVETHRMWNVKTKVTPEKTGASGIF
jgi:hypothetical protein